MDVITVICSTIIVTVIVTIVVIVIKIERHARATIKKMDRALEVMKSINETNKEDLI